MSTLSATPVGAVYVHAPFCAHPCFYCGCTRVITRDLHGRLCVHLQRTLVAAALDFISRAQIGTRLPLVTTSDTHYVEQADAEAEWSKLQRELMSSKGLDLDD